MHTECFVGGGHGLLSWAIVEKKQRGVWVLLATAITLCSVYLQGLVFYFWWCYVFFGFCTSFVRKFSTVYAAL